jgi:hypothetical protein
MPEVVLSGIVRKGTGFGTSLIVGSEYVDLLSGRTKGHVYGSP